MRCAYCRNDAKGTKEHIISHGVLSLFPECDLTYDEERNAVYKTEPMVKDVCSTCNNDRITYIDSYAKAFVEKYCVNSYSYEDEISVAYDYVMIQKVLLKYAFNDMRSRKYDTSFFDESVRAFLMEETKVVPLDNVSIFAGLAVNSSPIADMMMGNRKLRWKKDPEFFSDRFIRYVDYDSGKVYRNKNPGRYQFDGMQFSYIFRFNSIQFIMMCWEKGSEKIQINNMILTHLYPYSMLEASKTTVELSVCTNDMNYHIFGGVHVRGDGLMENMRLAGYGQQERSEFGLLGGVL